MISPIQQMTVAAPPPWSNGSLYQNNISIQRAHNQQQMAARFGGSKGGGVVVVPPGRIPYNDPSGDTLENIKNVAQTLTTLNAQAKFDNLVGTVQKAGRSRSRNLAGGWPAWGCMSGGRSRRRLRKTRRKLRKSRRKLRKSHRRRISK